MDNAEVREALKQLFDAAKINYSLDDSLKSDYYNGTVTFAFNKLSFRVALQAILKSAPMPITYRIDHGVYIFRPDRLGQANGREFKKIPGYMLTTSATAIKQRLTALSLLNSGLV